MPIRAECPPEIPFQPGGAGGGLDAAVQLGRAQTEHAPPVPGPDRGQRGHGGAGKVLHGPGAFRIGLAAADGETPGPVRGGFYVGPPEGGGFAAAAAMRSRSVRVRAAGSVGTRSAVMR